MGVSGVGAYWRNPTTATQALHFEPWESIIAHPAIAHLPTAYIMLVPEFQTLALPDEKLADCGNCPMVAPPDEPNPDHERFFLGNARCCTYHPTLPNFLVGNALLTGGVSRQRMLARIEMLEGVDALGIKPPANWSKRYDERIDAFGRDLDLRCPYWVGGEKACGIWRSRGVICRTWHCKYVDGPEGVRFWKGMRLQMGAVEERLALYCCDKGTVPARRSKVESWVAWFEWCASTVATMDTKAIEEARGDKLDAMRVVLGKLHAQIGRPLPEVVGASVKEFERLDNDRTRFVGYSGRDDLVGGRQIWAFLSKLDGVKPWRQALTEAEAELGEPIGEDLVHEMWRIGLIREHDDDDRAASVGSTEMSDSG